MEEYMVYRNSIPTYRNALVMAKLKKTGNSSPYEGIRSPLQDKPYDKDFHFTFIVKENWLLPDNLTGNVSFYLYSERLLQILKFFGVRFESFPITLVNEQGEGIKSALYFVFHFLEGVSDILDYEASGYTDSPLGVKQLVLLQNFEKRPIIVVDKIHVPIMRSDLVSELEKQGVTGFSFLRLEKFHIGKHGLVLHYDKNL